MRLGILAVCAVCVLGCTAAPRDSGFGDVQRVVNERIGQRVEWRRGEEMNPQALRDLLKDELTGDRAVEVALLNNPTLAATYEDLGIAQADLMEARVPRNPTIAAEVRFPQHAALPFEIELTQSLLDLLLMPVRSRAGE